MEGVTRRSFVRGAAALAVSGLYAGRISFAEAQARQERLYVLSRSEAQLFAAVGETLAHGAEAAGIAYFIDQQLAVAPADAMLLLKYLQFRSTLHWALSNLVALLRWNLFTYRDLWAWIDDPFETPPLTSPPVQGVLDLPGLGQQPGRPGP